MFIYFLTGNLEGEQRLLVSLKLREIRDRGEYVQNLYRDMLSVGHQLHDQKRCIICDHILAGM
jgi:hypothetical protein